MIEIKNLHYSYGKITALRGINLAANSGEITAIIGANGAGKSTLMKCIAGLLKPNIGEILCDGERLPAEPHNVVKRNIVLVPEGRWIFPNLTVEENLKMGAYTRNDKKEIEDTIEMIYKRFPRLKERRDQLSGTLSGGEQQMLAMGRALMSHPKLIVLDEPSMGLSPIYVNEIFDIIQKINQDDGVTVLLVEQNAKKALSIADRAYVLETGKIALSGDAQALMNDDSVRKAYLSE